MARGPIGHLRDQLSDRVAYEPHAIDTTTYDPAGTDDPLVQYKATGHLHIGVQQ